MNFNLYLDDETGMALNRWAQVQGESRNALVRRAVREWLQRQQTPDWPAEVREFQGIVDWPPFESHREGFNEPGDPFA